MLGYFTPNTKVPNTEVSTIQFQNIPKNELSIVSDFFKVEPMTYSTKGGKEYLNTTISLTEKGKKYLSTDLFINEYDVNVYLANNSTNDLYLTFSNLEWNIKEVKTLDLIIEKSDITNEDLLSDFNSQLEKLNKNTESNLIYSVEISPKSNSENIMRTIGMLHKK